MHVPAGALATDQDLGLALILESNPVELTLVATAFLDSLGALVVKLERHSFGILRALVQRTSGRWLSRLLSCAARAEGELPAAEAISKVDDDRVSFESCPEKDS
jgi:hypothetical protein